MSAEVTEADRDRAHQLWKELGKPEAAYPTPEQFLAFMRQCPDAIGLEIAARHVEHAEAARHCWIADHEGLQHQLRQTQVALAEANRKLDAVNAWLDEDAQ